MWLSAISQSILFGSTLKNWKGFARINKIQAGAFMNYNVA